MSSPAAQIVSFLSARSHLTQTETFTELQAEAETSVVRVVQAVAFKLTAATGVWPETVLHTFVGTDGFYPNGGLVFDGSGNLYGTTVGGGTPSWGVAFKLSHAGNIWRETTIYNFTGGSDGGNLVSGLTFDSEGNTSVYCNVVLATI